MNLFLSFQHVFKKSETMSIRSGSLLTCIPWLSSIVVVLEIPFVSEIIIDEKGDGHKSTKSVNAHDRSWKRWKWCRDRYEYSYSREKHVASEVAKERIRSALICESLCNYLLHDVTLIRSTCDETSVWDISDILILHLTESLNLFYHEVLIFI